MNGPVMSEDVPVVPGPPPRPASGTSGLPRLGRHIELRPAVIGWSWRIYRPVAVKMLQTHGWEEEAEGWAWSRAGAERRARYRATVVEIPL